MRILQPSSKAGEVELNVDVSSNKFSFLKNNKVDDLFIVPYAGYLVSLIYDQYNIILKGKLYLCGAICPVKGN